MVGVELELVRFLAGCGRPHEKKRAARHALREIAERRGIRAIEVVAPIRGPAGGRGKHQLAVTEPERLQATKEVAE